jgi:hypothetical protein
MVRATKDLLFTKKRREDTYEFEMTGDDGTTEKVEMLLRSISRDRYDHLVTVNPPTPAQRKEGATYNLDRFAPALISETLAEPQLDYEEAKALWNSEDWNRGELFSLFRKAVEVCNSGVSLDPTDSESA